MLNSTPTRTRRLSKLAPGDRNGRLHRFHAHGRERGPQRGPVRAGRKHRGQRGPARDRTGPRSRRLPCPAIPRRSRPPSSPTDSTASTTRSTSAEARRTTTTSPTGNGRAAASPRRATSSTPSPRRTSTPTSSISTSAPTGTTRRAAPRTSASGSSRTAARSRAATVAPTPTGGEHLLRSARGRRPVRLRRVHRRRRRLRRQHLQVGERRTRPAVHQDRRFVLQRRRHHLRADEHRTIPSTWQYSDNQGGSADGEILQGGFVEGGINLSAIYAGLGEPRPLRQPLPRPDRSSHPDTGVLEDFAGCAFNICSKLIVDKVVPSGDPDDVPLQREWAERLLRLVPAGGQRRAARQRPDQVGTYMVTESPATRRSGTRRPWLARTRA